MNERYLKILCIVGARPNFMKIAPILRAFEAHASVEPVLVHTGQHYDYAMNEAFFRQLGIPAPDVSLEVGSGSHAQQTAEIMKRFEIVVDQSKPACVLVVGDVNSTIACALVAAKKRIPVVHVEAGLRSRDRSMPEEINRILTDQISDRLYITERTAIANLAAEGISDEKVCFAGNVMIDTLLHSLPAAVSPALTLSAYAGTADRAERVGASADGYGVLTLHRPSNVDDRLILQGLLEALQDVAGLLPLVFPVHPRTQAKIDEAGLGAFFDHPNVLATGPLGYFEMLGLMRHARVVLTDSGGLQEETTALGVPCLTLRNNTERPITVSEGTNTLVGTEAGAIHSAIHSLLSGSGKAGRQPERWDGCAAERITADLVAWLEQPSSNLISQAA